MGERIQAPQTKSIDTVVKAFHVDTSNGLSSNEVEKQRQEYGENVLEEAEKISPIKILIDNIRNIIVYLLTIASIVAFIMGDPIEGIAVIVAILIAVMSGFFSEYKAQKSIESLQEMTTSIAKVKRDGEIKEIPSSEVVVGDILYVEEGDSVVADGRLIEDKNLACIESSLTGESEAVSKDSTITVDDEATIGDRKNMVYSGTSITRGNGYALVTAVGMDTEIGKISDMLQQGEQEATPLEKELVKLGKALIIFAGIVAVVVTIAGIVTGKDIYDVIKIGIILAIAAVPEALPAVSTITLALGMRTMASHNALVKSLPAVETLGSTTVICTDKTGTLTENQMTVKHIILASEESYTVEGKGYEPKGDIKQDDKVIDVKEKPNLQQLIEAGVLSSNATLTQEDGYKIVGDPTEGGIVVLGEKVSINRRELEEKHKRIGEIPFSSDDKYMATAYERENGDKEIYIKGAPDVLINRMSQKTKSNSVVESANERLAKEGMRVLAIAKIVDYKGDGSEDSMREALEKGVELLGLIGIVDPPRADVAQVIQMTKDAGIRVLMITGDHPKTAVSIAEKIGIADSSSVITGKEMDNMSNKELAEAMEHTSIFARVSPKNKLQIVEILNNQKEVTAMTGDGVNDAPALNGADIGVAMGVRGTEVAKEASDMILTDDRFSTIVDAVKEGRNIFDNIEKFVYFLFSCNVVEILAVFLTIVLRLPMPIVALQILWLNLVIDVLPAMSLAWEPAEEDVMKRPPKKTDQAIVTKGFLIKVLVNGSLISLGAFAVFVIGLESGFSETASRTMAFTTMAFGQLLHIFNVREKEGFGIDRSVFKNPILLGALGLSLGLQLFVIYTPFMNGIMETEPLWIQHWSIVLLGAVIPTIIIQLYRRLLKRVRH